MVPVKALVSVLVQEQARVLEMRVLEMRGLQMRPHSYQKHTPGCCSQHGGPPRAPPSIPRSTAEPIATGHAID